MLWKKIPIIEALSRPTKSIVCEKVAIIDKIDSAKLEAVTDIGSNKLEVLSSLDCDKLKTYAPERYWLQEICHHG